jgi:maltose alpha-D-glucosyltransferase/alpha-amylase
MQWDDSSFAGFTSGTTSSEFVKGELGYQNVNVASQINDPNSLFNTIKKMIAVRRKHDAFGSSGMEWINANNPSVAVYIREYKDDVMVIINNLSSSSQTIQLPREYQKSYLDLFSGAPHTFNDELTLAPYGYLWLQMQK